MDVDGARKLHAGTHALSYRRDGMEVVSPYGDDGILSDWDAVEALCDHILKYDYNFWFRYCAGMVTSYAEERSKGCCPAVLGCARL